MSKARKPLATVPIVSATPVLLYLNGLLVRGEKPNFNMFWRGPRTGWKKLVSLPREVCSANYTQACARGDLHMAALWLAYLTVQKPVTVTGVSGLYVHEPSEAWIQAVTQAARENNLRPAPCKEHVCPPLLMREEQEIAA